MGKYATSRLLMRACALAGDLPFGQQRDTLTGRQRRDILTGSHGTETSTSLCCRT